MPTTLATYFPYDAGAGANVTEAQWRSMARLWAPNGVHAGQANELAVSSDDSGMNVEVDTGSAWVQGAYGSVSSQQTLTISAADGSNDRIDRIIVRNDFTNNRLELDVLEGTPAPSPSAPALTQNTAQWEESLARVLIPTAAVNVLDANITDERLLVVPAGSEPLLLTSAGSTSNPGAGSWFDTGAEVTLTPGVWDIDARTRTLLSVTANYNYDYRLRDTTNGVDLDSIRLTPGWVSGTLNFEINQPLIANDYVSVPLGSTYTVKVQVNPSNGGGTDTHNGRIKARRIAGP